MSDTPDDFSGYRWAPFEQRPWERLAALKKHSEHSLGMAYRLALRLPFDHDVSGLTKDEMIRAILDAEYGSP